VHDDESVGVDAVTDEISRDELRRHNERRAGVAGPA
jgi:hypothetical protein